MYTIYYWMLIVLFRLTVRIVYPVMLYPKTGATLTYKFRWSQDSSAQSSVHTIKCTDLFTVFSVQCTLFSMQYYVHVACCVWQRPSATSWQPAKSNNIKSYYWLFFRAGIYWHELPASSHWARPPRTFFDMSVLSHVSFKSVFPTITYSKQKTHTISDDS